MDKIILDRLEVECVIGIFDWEREIKQKVLISFELDCDLAEAVRTDDIRSTVDYKSISKDILALVEPSRFYLIETMAEKIAGLCLGYKGVSRAAVTVSKPGAIRNSENVSVTVVRPAPGAHRVFLGIGGNIDPERNIKLGIDIIRDRFTLVQLSPAYRSEPWGVSEPQADYINLAAEIRTAKDIFSIRGELCWIEKLIGRKRTGDKFAPRPLDIDLLLFDDMTGEHAGGPLPHPQLTTQQFVYLPMMDIAPDLLVPGTGKALREIEPDYDSPGLRIEKADFFIP